MAKSVTQNIVGFLSENSNCVPNFKAPCTGFDGTPYYLNVATSNNMKLVEYEMFSSETNFDEAVDSTTLLGNLSTGQVDLIIYPLFFTEKRFQFLDFSLPVLYDKVCCFVSSSWLNSKVSGHQDMFFLLPLPWLAWTMFSTVVISLSLARAVFQHFLNDERYNWVIRFCLGVLITCFTCAYSIRLKVQFTPRTVFHSPFKSIDDLVRLVKRDNYRFVIDDLHDFRVEVLNSSKSDALQKLRSEIFPKKLIVVPPYQVWQSLGRYKNSFTFDSLERFSRRNREDTNILKYCFDELPSMNAGYAFKKRSSLINRINGRIEFLYANEYKYAKKRTSINRFLTQHKKVSEMVKNIPLSLKTTKILFDCFLSAMAICILTLLIEKRMKRNWAYYSVTEED